MLLDKKESIIQIKLPFLTEDVGGDFQFFEWIGENSTYGCQNPFTTVEDILFEEVDGKLVDTVVYPQRIRSTDFFFANKNRKSIERAQEEGQLLFTDKSFAFAFES